MEVGARGSKNLVLLGSTSHNYEIAKLTVLHKIIFNHPMGTKTRFESSLATAETVFCTSTSFCLIFLLTVKNLALFVWLKIKSMSFFIMQH
jgi:hypothetical protein